MAKRKAKSNDNDKVEFDLMEMERLELEKEKEVRYMSAIIRKGLVEQVFDFSPEELISGSASGLETYDIVLRTKGEYKRGELLMMDGNQFVKATKDKLSTAESLVILDESITVGDEEYAETMAYCTGHFFAKNVILPYETESDSHEELIEALRPVLMKFKIFLD